MASNEESSSVRFHRKCGHLITLSPCGRTAFRNYANQEFNHGLVMSSSPLQEDQLFEVRLDKKINSWSGSIEVGVVACDPDEFEIPLPSSATEIRNGAWVLSGNSILKDGRSIQENYGSTDLDKLEEDDRVGVLRTSQGDLVFYVNGVSQSIAASGLPDKLWAIIDLYGKCSQVTLMDDSLSQTVRISLNDQTNVATAAASNKNIVNLISSGNIAQHNLINLNIVAMSFNNGESLPQNQDLTTSAIGEICGNNNFSSNKLRFHERKGALVKLSNNHRTAERRRPYDEFNHGVVMTHRTLEDDELFEIRIDRIVEKWIGSIEIGITTHNPDLLEFPATMTNLKSGTLMMSGCGILTNGKGTRRKYGDFNLDDLREGDRLGLMRKSNGDLHFYVNGLDQGVAATRLSQQLWGAVDLYGLTVKVTIVDRDERDEQNLITRRAVGMREQFGDENRLAFHQNCGSHAAVMNGGRTAHRPNANCDFNFGVVLTNRPLKPNETFEVRLDKMVTKWAGSIEIGVTTHSPNDLEFPSTMTDVRSGTWMMTGNGVMHNGTTLIEGYGKNLDKLKVGDRVAVVRKENGTIHFFVNSEDQGPAAVKVPERVFGVIDLYGQAAQATVIDLPDDHLTTDCGTEGESCHVPSFSVSSGINVLSDDFLRFHHLHGRNARISSNGLSATRPNALGEFNDAIVMSNRPLRDGELFEVVIERTVDRWSGSIEAGVSLIRPEELEFPNTMTDIDYHTWMLSGSAVMRDGRTVRNGYCCDLDTLGVGSRIGMVRNADGTLHYMINGEDQGIACHNIPSGVFGVIDLYGQCSAVSLVLQNSQSTCSATGQPNSHLNQLISLIHQELNSLASSQIMESSHASLPAPVVGSESQSHHFISNTRNVELKNNNSLCIRHPNTISALVFTSICFDAGENYHSFEIRIEKVISDLAGSVRFGVTTTPPGSCSTLASGISSLGKDTIWLESSNIKMNGKVIRHNYCPSIERLKVGDRIKMRHCPKEGSIKFYWNSEDFGPVSIPVKATSKLYPVVELYGSTVSVSCTNLAQGYFGSARSQESLLPDEADNQHSRKRGNKNSDELTNDNSIIFNDFHGKNVELRNGSKSAVRTESFNQGLVFSSRPLLPNESFELTLVKLDPRWSSSLMIGLSSLSPEKIYTTASALDIREETFVFSGSFLYRNGVKITSFQNFNLDSLQPGNRVGISISTQEMRININGNDLCQKFPLPPGNFSYYGLVDLYGQCAEISLNTDTNLPEMVDSMVIENVIEKTDNSLPKSPRPACKQQCEYMNLCQRFKATFGLPSSFFLAPVDHTCFCVTCLKHRGDELYKKKGDPPKDYAVPQGWVRFALRANHKPNWHVAYHGLKAAHLRRVLDRGQLLPKGELGLGQKPNKSKSKEDDSDAPQLLFSPTIKFVGSHQLSPPVKYLDNKSGKIYQGQVALELEVHPGSYKISSPSIPIQLSDTHFKVDETEWLTKERGNTVMTALLIQLSL